MRWIEGIREATKRRLGVGATYFAEALISVILVAVALSSFAWKASLAHPSPQLLRDVTQVGAALFIAYAVAIASLRPIKGEALSEHRDFLWGGIGIGVAGLIGLGAGLALAAYREAGHESALDIFGLCWMVAALCFMGAIVTIYPILVWQAEEDD